MERPGSNPTKGNRIEICGVLCDPPELRTTPSGNDVLSLTVECGGARRELFLAVVMAGEQARETARQLRAGQWLAVSGSLNSVMRRLKSGVAQTGLEVVASEIKPGPHPAD